MFHAPSSTSFPSSPSSTSSTNSPQAPNVFHQGLYGSKVLGRGAQMGGGVVRRR